MGKTLYDKIWHEHFIPFGDDPTGVLYVDRHLVHEVSTPQAFEGMRASGRRFRRPRAHLAVADHALPTTPRTLAIPPGRARQLVERLELNVRAFDVPYIPTDHAHQGIVHVIGPELGFTLPGTVLVCGDSHTCTHGAFGCLAIGIGASECELVFATQCLPQARAKTMRITLNGELSPGVTAKDVVLAILGRIGASGATGHAVEYAGPFIRGLSMEGRMTICNMSIEAGARIGIIAPDDTTFAYLKGRQMAPKGRLWDEAVAAWRTYQSDDDAVFDTELEIDVGEIAPHVTWGTSPQDALPIDSLVPDPDVEPDPARRARLQSALRYMKLTPGTRLEGMPIDRVFIGSCTNGRLEDLRAAAAVIRGRHVAAGVSAMVVPGSSTVRAQATAEGLDQTFIAAGFEWREAGCSMCVAMNGDALAEGERCASTSNRNFEGRQGRGGLTHLMSPQMAALSAITGCISDIRTTQTP
jgi:3-isopropylmalate/(R)-2-methylmalate dehydratase large subunit